MTDHPTIIPSMRYADAPTAIAWLCDAFGFEQHLVVPGEGDTIRHAQLTFGNGMIMLGSTRDDDYGRLMKLPAEAGGSTKGIYVIVDDVDAHYERARAAGADIISAPEPQPHGGKLYTCKDLEGHLWNFGSYNPWSG